MKTSKSSSNLPLATPIHLGIAHRVQQVVKRRDGRANDAARLRIPAVIAHIFTTRQIGVSLDVLLREHPRRAVRLPLGDRRLLHPLDDDVTVALAHHLPALSTALPYLMLSA